MVGGVVVAVVGAMVAAVVGVDVLVMVALAEPRLDEKDWLWLAQPPQWPWDSSHFKHLTISLSMEKILMLLVLSVASTGPHQAMSSPFIATDNMRSGG